MNTPNAETVRIARMVIHDSTYLLDRDEFKRFLDRWRATSDKWADDILHNNEMTDGERHNLRMKRLGVLEVLQSPYQDRDAQYNVLANMGIKAEELNPASAPM